MQKKFEFDLEKCQFISHKGAHILHTYCDGQIWEGVTKGWEIAGMPVPVQHEEGGIVHLHMTLAKEYMYFWVAHYNKLTEGHPV